MPGTEDERDLGQVQLAIESVRALMPQIEQIAPQQAAPIRDAVSQLQMAFVQAQGGAAADVSPASGETPEPTAGGTDSAGSAGRPDSSDAQPPEAEPPQSGGQGPAQRSGRLWVPGQ
jgi:hypothetical protein